MVPFDFHSPRAISEHTDSSARFPGGVGKTSSSKLMRSMSPEGLLCRPGTAGLAEDPSPSDLNALACEATESRGGTVTGFRGAEGWMGFSEETGFFGSRGRGAGVGTFFPPTGPSAMGPPPGVS